MNWGSLLEAGVAAYGAYSAADAAQDAAATQSASADSAIQLQQDALTTMRGDLAPYRDVGASVLPGLQGLVTSPDAQKEFIGSNPFYSGLADDAQSRIFNNAAARGKVGSGGTAEALQNSLMLLGNDLVNQNVNQRMNIATMGGNAAAGSGSGTLNSASTIGDLYTQQGNVLAAGQIGSSNAVNSGLNTVLDTGYLQDLLRK